MKRRLFCLLTVLSLFLCSAEARRRWIPKIASGGAYNPATDPTVVEWLKADGVVYNTGTTQATNGQKATTWVANTGQNAIQVVTANQPTFFTAVQNGLPVLDFYPVTLDQNWMSAATFGTLSQPYTVWIVFKAQQINDYYTIYTGLAPGSSAELFVQFGLSAWGIYAGGSADSSGTDDTNWHIIKITFNGASSKFAIDGGSDSTINPGTDPLIGLTIANANDHSKLSPVTVGEIIVQNADPSGATSSIFSYLNGRWAVY